MESQWISLPVNATCWVCQGTTFTGMTPEQIEWYLQNYKFLRTIKSKSLRAGEITDMIGWAKFKLRINKACGLLGIRQTQIEVVSKKEWVHDVVRLNLRNEFSEYERRMKEIVLAATGKGSK